MPIYEYKCENCHDTFEILQKVNENPLTECILCHEGPVKKLISVSSFVLKGAGFYVNDYPSEGRKKSQKSEKSEKSEKSTGSSTTTSKSKESSTKTAKT